MKLCLRVSFLVSRLKLEMIIIINHTDPDGADGSSSTHLHECTSDILIVIAITENQSAER